MTYRFIRLIPILLIIIFSSCEQPLEEENFPYEMKLVVRGIIEPGKLVENIYLGRTLPIGVPFNEDFANLKDAIGAIVSEGIFYPLRHYGNGLYTTDSLMAIEGNTYFILAQWQDKSASAQTFIPMSTIIIGNELISYQEEGSTIYYLEGNINPRENESYAASWVLQNSNGEIMIEAETFFEVINSTGGQPVTIRTAEIPINVISIHNNSSSRLGLRLYTYDRAFYDYYISQGSGQISDAIFGQPAANIRWNIKGDGIGMFIGRSNSISLLP